MDLPDDTDVGSQASSVGEEEEDAAVWLQDKQIKFVRLMWCDSAGLRRCRVIPASRFTSAYSHGVGLTKAVMSMPVFADTPAEGSGLSVIGEVRIVPDPLTLRRLPWHPSHALCMVDMHEAPGRVWDACPRSCLKRILSDAMTEFGLTVRVGLELEFMLLEPTGSRRFKPVDNSGYCQSSAFDAQAELLDFMISTLAEIGITVEQVHAESCGGQFELCLHHMPALEAADALVLMKETVTAVAHRHGLKASFIPKMYANSAGSGSHFHLSIMDDERNVFGAQVGSEHLSLHRGGDNKSTKGSPSNSRYGMSLLGQQFVAGLLHHLPAMLPFTCPLPNSYQRITPGTWSGAYCCWGVENREASIRVCSPPGSPPQVCNNVELKCPDGACNPYLALAAAILSGIDGIRKKLPLPPPADEDPHVLSEGERARSNIKKLPATLSEALGCLEKDTFLQLGLGSDLVQAYTAVKQSEVKFFGKLSPDVREEDGYTAEVATLLQKL